MKKILIKPVNDMCVCDDNINIIIMKKPKQRYRTIIRAFYKRRYNQY